MNYLIYKNKYSWINLLIFLYLSLTFHVQVASASTVDVLIVYDTTANTWVSSNGGLATFTDDAVNRMNQALQNSGLTDSFRLAGTMISSYTTTSDGSVSLSDDLNWLIASSAIASEHDNVGADLVAMFVDTGSAYGYVGIGNLLTTWAGNSNAAFSVNAIRSVDTGHTLTHEIGHNLGAHHAKNQASSPGPNPYLDNQYSAGWYFTGTNGTSYHTIMAYNSDGYGSYYTGAPLFSTPLRTYEGTVAGSVQDGDNSRLLSQTFLTVAAYKTSGGPVVSNPNPVDGASVSAGSSGQLLRVTASGATSGVIYYDDDSGISFNTTATINGNYLEATIPYTSGRMNDNGINYWYVEATNASGTTRYPTSGNLSFTVSIVPDSFPWAMFIPAILSAVNNQNSGPGVSCASGKVYDCVMKCVDSSTAQSWIEDGSCDDGTYGIDLRCPAFLNDGGDCN